MSKTRNGHEHIQSIAVFDMIKITVLLAAEYHFHPVEIPDQSR